MDGFSSAKKMSREMGGGGNYGNFAWPGAYFVAPIADVVRSKRKATSATGCSSTFRAGDEIQNKNDVNMIVHLSCQHEIVHAIIGIYTVILYA
jgi:hypothetical protein